MPYRSVRKIVRLAVKKINILSVEELCEVYDKLNHWEWDGRLGEKPIGYDKLKWYHNGWRPIKTRFSYLRPICKKIEETVTEKELLRYHHIHNLHSTNEDFEMWWKNRKTRRSSPKCQKQCL